MKKIEERDGVPVQKRDGVPVQRRDRGWSVG